MLGLLVLIGSLFAGIMVDALSSEAPPEDDEAPVLPESDSLVSLSDFLSDSEVAQNDMDSKADVQPSMDVDASVGDGSSGENLFWEAVGDNTLNIVENADSSELEAHLSPCENILAGSSENDFIVVDIRPSQDSDHGDFVANSHAYGGDGDDTIMATTGLSEGDTLEAFGELRLEGGSGNDLIVASHIYKIDAGEGDDTVIIVGDASFDSQTVSLGEGADVLAAQTGEYQSWASVADFDPLHDRIAVVVPTISGSNPVSITWDPISETTCVEMEDYFRFFLTGVNGETTPISISFYSNQADLLSGQHFRVL